MVSKDKTVTIKFSVDEKKRIIPLIQQYFEEERGEEIGNLAAEFLLEFFAAEVGPFIYNRAIHDALNTLKDNAAELEYRFYELEKPIPGK